MAEIVIVPEAACARAVSEADAFTAVEAVFAAMARGEARNFPVIREALGHADALYGFKSGFDRAGLALGVKSGGFWPHNAEIGLTNHQSTIFLFDPDTGQLRALVGGNYLTAVRTAAAAAVSVAHLARPDAQVLGMIGAGHQAAFQLSAVLRQRKFTRVVAWNRDPAKLDRLAAVAEKAGVGFEAAEPQAVCAAADVIVTITSSFAPLLKDGWVRPGTHLACMGTDTAGKQEVAAGIVGAASVFTDEVAQSVTIGEAQHAVKAGQLSAEAIIPLGAVINGAHPGRQSGDEITLFDGTGVGLQDLAVAQVAMRVAAEQGLAQTVSL
ncbi:MAG: ornithine cyclodeaminase family protein [Limimaricola sp.]|uniref:iminosuccinate reductase BhcD n=1 Tax=Limimaricola sp. TaxID=2211665 RepID=UPI001D75D072|nr:iminosuccinate reductase BhcD [Limimaricola sp.]MBI1416424.1 ornithine cyclodeaminase family protein [Limimaricola sp.]